MDNLVNVGLLLSAVLCLVGDIFIDNISKSVFLVAIDDGGDDITAGTFIVTDADDGVNDDDRLLGNTNVTDVTISSSSVAELLTAALVVVSLDVAVDVVVVAFPFCSYVYYFVISLKLVRIHVFNDECDKIRDKTNEEKKTNYSVENDELRD